MKTPTEIVEEMDARFSLVSRILGDLKDKEILVCVNEEDEPEDSKTDRSRFKNSQ